MAGDPMRALAERYLIGIEIDNAMPEMADDIGDKVSRACWGLAYETLCNCPPAIASDEGAAAVVDVLLYEVQGCASSDVIQPLLEALRSYLAEGGEHARRT